MSTGFLHADNKAVLQRVLYKDICRRYGGDLNEKQAARLIKTVDYYATEVHRVHGNKNIQFLNTEVLGAVLPDYMAYLERNERSVTRSVVSDIEEGPAVQEQPRRQLEDIDNAFSALQTQRQEVKSRPTMQDFHISLSEEPPLSMELFERMKKEREAVVEANPFVQASDSFLQGSKKAQEDTEFLLAEQERKKLEKRANITLPVPPDMRAIYEQSASQRGTRPPQIRPFLNEVPWPTFPRRFLPESPKSCPIARPRRISFCTVGIVIGYLILRKPAIILRQSSTRQAFLELLPITRHLPCQHGFVILFA